MKSCSYYTRVPMHLYKVSLLICLLLTTILRATYKFLDWLPPANSTDKSLGSVLPWSTNSSMVFYPHSRIAAALLNFSAVLQERIEIRRPPKSQVIEYVINKNIIGSLFILSGFSTPWNLTDSKRRCIQNVFFLFSKTGGISLTIWDSAQSDILSDVPPHT